MIPKPFATKKGAVLFLLFFFFYFHFYCADIYIKEGEELIEIFLTFNVFNAPSTQVHL